VTTLPNYEAKRENVNVNLECINKNIVLVVHKIRSVLLLEEIELKI